MVALALITLLLTGFTFILYSYLANRSERDVSFFLAVCMVSMVMNLCTNLSSSLYVFGIVYLIIDVLFIGLSFAVDCEISISFYKSIGPWFKNTFTGNNVLLKVLSFIVFPAGIVLYFVDYSGKPELARTCGRSAIFGILLWALLLWAILGVAL